MNKNTSEAKRVAITLSAENNRALRLLAALQGRKPTDVVDEFLSQSGLEQALGAEFSRAAAGKVQSAPEPQETPGMTHDEIMYRRMLASPMSMPPVNPRSFPVAEPVEITDANNEEVEY